MAHKVKEERKSKVEVKVLNYASKSRGGFALEYLVPIFNSARMPERTFTMTDINFTHSFTSLCHE